VNVWKVITGDCRSVLATMEANSVQCCVTSPPYYGLRDYGTATWEGGDAACNHLEAASCSTQNLSSNGGVGHAYKDTCHKCGAVRVDAQLGLEKTHAEYVAKMVEVFAAVRRVLRDDGTLWLNLGDSYAWHSQGTYPAETISGGVGGQSVNRQEGLRGRAGLARHRNTSAIEFRSKELMGIPWRVAFALQADGWYLRQDIIWHKPNPMPESVKDRCTKAHEYLFLLAKSERYHFDADAMKEKAATGDNGTRNRRSVWSISPESHAGDHFAVMPTELVRPCVLAGCPVGELVLDPFSGSGTTGEVAVRHGRRYVGIELNPEYVAMAEKRIGEADDHLFAKKETK